MINSSQLIGKSAILQVDEDGCVPDEIWNIIQRRSYFFDDKFLERFHFLKTGITIKSTIIVHHWDDEGKNILEAEYFLFEETGDARFPSKYFQIAIKNHPLTNIFGD